MILVFVGGINIIKEFNALEKATKILQLNENHLPNHNENYNPDDFKKENYPYCMNYPLR